VTDPKSAVYEIFNYIQGIEQLTVTTLRNVIGSLDLEQTLTSRDQINGTLRGVLDEATGKWGIRVNRVELKAIDPPASVQDSMEQQMRAERSRRATILTAEGVKQSQILTAEGEKQSNILRAEARHRPRSSTRKGRRGPSRRSSTRSTAATPTRSCSPTSTCRCCRRSRRARRTSCGSCRPS
jgi:regulator of protease activity HflC (stomatin/prohibitin superfamily)